MEVWGIPVGDMSAPVLLGIAIVLILRGRLVPRSTYDDLRADRDQWREAHRLSEEARLTQTRQLDAVLEVGETVKNVMNALDSVRREGRPE
jgi:hypothetical protein